MKVGIFATLLLAILLAGGASADYEFHNLSEVNDRVEWADLAVSPEGMIVAAWAVREQGVWTRTVRADMLETPVFHGEGSMPTVCWAPDGSTSVQRSVVASTPSTTSWCSTLTCTVGVAWATASTMVRRLRRSVARPLIAA